VKLVLVRHGETEWNKSGKFQGQADIALNERGLSQAKETARAAISWRPTALYSSPLIRTRQVAEEIARVTGLTVATDPRLQELDLGKMEGATGDQMRTGWPLIHATWRKSPELVTMPGGESLVQLQERTWQAIEAVANAHGEADTIVVVSHNFAIRAICGTLLGMPLSSFHRMYLHLSSVTTIDRVTVDRVTVDRGPMGWRLLCYNSTAHLSPANQPT
jgi:broad specificity phosphatase PhoE